MRKITYSVAQLRELYHPSQPPTNFHEYEEIVGSTKPFSPLSFSNTNNISKINVCNNSTQNLMKHTNNQNCNQNNLAKSQDYLNTNSKCAFNWEPTNNHKRYQNNSNSTNNANGHHQICQNDEILLKEKSTSDNFQNEASLTINESYQTQFSSRETPKNENPIPYQSQFLPQNNLNQNNLMQSPQINQSNQPIQQINSPYFIQQPYVNPMMAPFNPLQINLMQPMQLITPFPQMVSAIPCQIPQISPYSPYEPQSFSMQTNYSMIQQQPPQQFYQGYPANPLYYQPFDVQNMNSPPTNSDGGSNFLHSLNQQIPNPINNNYLQQVPFSNDPNHFQGIQPFNEYFENQQESNQNHDLQYFQPSFQQQQSSSFQNDNFESVLNSNEFENPNQISGFYYNYDDPNVKKVDQENKEDLNIFSTKENEFMDSFESVLNIPSLDQKTTFDNHQINGFINDSNQEKQNENLCDFSFEDNENFSSSSSSSIQQVPTTFIPVHLKHTTSVPNKENGIHLNQANNENNNNNKIDEFSPKTTFNPQKLSSTSYYVSSTSVPTISQAVKPPKRNKYF